MFLFAFKQAGAASVENLTVSSPKTIPDAQKDAQNFQPKQPVNEEQHNVFLALNMSRRKILTLKVDQPLDEKTAGFLKEYGYLKTHYISLTSTENEKRSFSEAYKQLISEAGGYYQSQYKNQEKTEFLYSQYAALNVLNSQGETDEKKNRVLFAETRQEIEGYMKDWGYYELYKKELERLSAMNGFNAMTPDAMMIRNVQERAILSKIQKDQSDARDDAVGKGENAFWEKREN